MECVRIDLNNVCRTCKCESPEMKSLYYRDSDSGKENPRIDEMLMACSSVQVNNEDGLPKSICRSCFVQLKNAYSFKEQCEKTDVFLRDYVKSTRKDNVKKEDIKEEGSMNGLELTSGQGEPDTAENSKNKTENEIKDDPESNDDVQVIDNNLALFECTTCSKAFFSMETLTSHQRTHTRRTFKCKQCDKSYTRMNHLRRHQSTHGKRKVHICKICNKTLTRFEHLKRHLVTHLKEKPFGCQTCNRSFNRPDHLQNHVKCCKGEKVYICDICNKGFNREDSLEVHRRLHENKMPVLPTLENLDNIEQHYMEIEFGEDENGAVQVGNDNAVDNFSDEEYNDIDNTDGGDDNVGISEETIEPEVEVSENDDQEKINEIANITNAVYVEDDSPEMLMEKAEIIEEEQAAEADENAADNGNDYESDNSTHSEYLPTKQPLQKIKRGRGRPRKHPVTYKKSLDSGRRRGRPLLKSKIKIEDDAGNYSCPECKETFTKLKLLERHAESHKGLRIHECGTCGKTFKRLNSLKRHKLSHSDVKSFLCITCRKWFSRRDHLQKHMKLHFNNSDGTSAAHSCELCHVVFSREENLLKHKAYKHNIGEKVVMAEKKFKCDYCQKGFTTEKYRDAHMKAHFCDKKHQCKTCEKTFISKSHLNEHVKFHNDSSKKFLCSECGQRFIRNDYLTIHMRRHRGEKPFKCKFCGKGFPRTTDLTVHERYHTGEKTHLCVVCGRGFGRAYNLTVHMRTHTGEKPYRCTYCDAAFAQGNDLKAHVRRHTGERYQCELCPETFLMGYLLTQHKRVVHGLNVVSNIRRLQPVATLNPDDPPPVTIPLPPPIFIPSGTASVTEITTTAFSDPLQFQQNELSEFIKEELK